MSNIFRAAMPARLEAPSSQRRCNIRSGSGSDGDIGRASDRQRARTRMRPTLLDWAPSTYMLCYTALPGVASYVLQKKGDKKGGGWGRLGARVPASKPMITLLTIPYRS